jgi:hypothetical protein
VLCSRLQERAFFFSAGEWIAAPDAPPPASANVNSETHYFVFAGEHAFHSRLEWVSVQDMEKAMQTIVHLAMVWEERA